MISFFMGITKFEKDSNDMILNNYPSIRHLYGIQFST